jgi:hypothetical protein
MLQQAQIGFLHQIFNRDIANPPTGESQQFFAMTMEQAVK